MEYLASKLFGLVYCLRWRIALIAARSFAEYGIDVDDPQYAMRSGRALARVFMLEEIGVRYGWLNLKKRTVKRPSLRKVVPPENRPN